MKLFITGGGGFVGSSLILSLGKKYDVICFGHRTNFTELEKLVGDNVKFVEGELTDKELLDSEMGGVDVVVHLGGLVGNEACMKDPLKATLSHTVGTQNILQSTFKHNVKKFVFASTQSVYTTYIKRPIPFTEGMELKPDDFYGSLKATAEYDVINSRIDYVILRFTNMYGYGSGLYINKDSGAIGKFIRAGLDGGEITVYGTGEQGIDYLHISDACSLLSQVIERGDIKNEIINVGSGKLFKIKDLVSVVIKLAKEINGKDVVIKNLPAPEGSVWPDRVMSIEKVRNLLGWAPRITVEEALREIFLKLK